MTMSDTTLANGGPSSDGLVSTVNITPLAEDARRTPGRRSPRPVDSTPETVGRYASRLADILGRLSPRQRRETMTVLATMLRHGDTAVGGLQTAAALCADIPDITAARAVLGAVLEALAAGADVRPELRSVVHATVSATLGQEAAVGPQEGRGRKARGR
jgi:hypothetical protein